MSHLQKHPKSGVYRYRRRVPPELRPFMPEPHRNKIEIRRSLDTKDLREAKRRNAEFGALVEQWLANAKRRAEGIATDTIALNDAGPSLPGAGESLRWDDSMTLGQAEAIAQHWMNEFLTGDAEWRLDRDASEFERRDELLHLSGLSEGIKESVAANQLYVAEAWLPLVMEKYGLLHLAPHCPSWKRLASALLRAAREVTKVQKNRAEGQWDFDPKRSEQPQQFVTIEEMFEKWVETAKPAAQTRDEARLGFERFLELTALNWKTPIHLLSENHAWAFADEAQKLPKVVSAERFQGKSLRQIIAMTVDEDDVPRQSPGNVQKHLNLMKAAMNVMVQRKKIAANPFNPVKLETDDGEDKRLPFALDELKKFFDSRLFAGNQWGVEQWVFVIALFTGARLEEIGQLTVSDIRTEDNIDFFDMSVIEDGKRRKNKKSKKFIPVHSALIDLGFVQYVDGLRSKGMTMVFPELTRNNKYNKITKALSTTLNRRIDKYMVDDPRKDFHSFRHTFKDACRRAHVPKEIHDRFSGHASSDVGDSYGIGHPMAVLKRFMDSIHYEDLEIAGRRIRRG
ncbi:MAG: site-specific integrase [Alphaproteobacteria bacterium]|nr:site-specific integrase [Alphaproteobacteria bacterium]